MNLMASVPIIKKIQLYIKGQQQKTTNKHANKQTNVQTNKLETDLSHIAFMEFVGVTLKGGLHVTFV